MSAESGDTTMREIDMFIGDELRASGASGSLVMTTDENISPVLSSSLTRFSKLAKFQGTQVSELNLRGVLGLRVYLRV